MTATRCVSPKGRHRAASATAGDLPAVAVRLIRWEEIAAAIDSSLEGIEGANWYAPVSSATLIRAYFLRPWFGVRDSTGANGRSSNRFNYFFEHYQLRDIARRLIERQLQVYGIALRDGDNRSAARATECGAAGVPFLVSTLNSE